MHVSKPGFGEQLASTVKSMQISLIHNEQKLLFDINISVGIAMRVKQFEQKGQPVSEKGNSNSCGQSKIRFASLLFCRSFIFKDILPPHKAIIIRKLKQLFQMS